MGKPLAAAKTCSDELLRSWGAEPGAVARFRAGTGPARYLTYNSYPEAAIRAREQGRTVALVTVDRMGKPSTCRTMRSTGSATLDKTTCLILMGNAHSEPPSATEAERRFAALPVRWALP
ncbi:TonB family protein [uncultured Sphingomonas sp.]|uniref:TonB family protein n=1 Tax=uncultured Sphingomonas sp. TaxID=158754 RepID=UPI0035CAB2C7